MPMNVDDIKERMVERYNKFTSEFKDEVKRQKTERLEDVKAALKTAKERLKKTTDATEEELEQIARTVEKEMKETVGKAGKTLRKLEEKAWQRPRQRLMNSARHLLKEVSGRVKTAAGDIEGGMEKGMAYFSGNAVDGGSFICNHCGKEVYLPLPEDLPECSECGKTVFKKKEV